MSKSINQKGFRIQSENRKPTDQNELKHETVWLQLSRCRAIFLEGMGALTSLHNDLNVSIILFLCSSMFFFHYCLLLSLRLKSDEPLCERPYDGPWEVRVEAEGVGEVGEVGAEEVANRVGVARCWGIELER